MCLQRGEGESTHRVHVISDVTDRIRQQIDGGPQVYRDYHLPILAMGTSKIVVLDISVGYAFPMQGKYTQGGLAQQRELDPCVIFVLAQEVLGYVAVQPLQYTISASDCRRTSRRCTRNGQWQLGQGLHQLKATRLVHQAFQEFALTIEQVHTVSCTESLKVGVEEFQRNRSACMRVDGVKYDRQGTLVSLPLSGLCIAIDDTHICIASIQRCHTVKPLD